MAKRFLTPINVLNAASDPGTASEGDLYYNTASDKLRIYSNSSWTDVSASGGGSNVPTGGGTDQVFYNNDQQITANYSIPSNKNSMSAGPITINNGVTVTIPSGSFWTIV